MPPCPPSAERKFLLAAGGCVGIVESLWRVDDSKLAQEFVERRISVAQAGELDLVSVDVLHDRGFQRDRQLSQVSQLCGFHSEKLN